MIDGTARRDVLMVDKRTVGEDTDVANQIAPIERRRRIGLVRRPAAAARSSIKTYPMALILSGAITMTTRIWSRPPYQG